MAAAALCYVALRKSAQAKQETREQHAKAQSLAQKQRQLAGGFCSSGSIALDHLAGRHLARMHPLTLSAAGPALSVKQRDREERSPISSS